MPPSLDLRLHTEPIVHLADHRLVAREVLLRPCTGPRLDRLIGRADLDLAWLLETALGCARPLLAAARVPVHVNVTGPDLARRDLVAQAVRIVGRDLLPWLVLEVTEQLPLASAPHVADNLEALRSLGVRLAIDDFADGWSGPAAVAAVRPEVIKVRLCRLTGRHGHGTARRLRRLAAEHGSEVVVEQIETVGDLRTARRLGFDHGQGWYWPGALPLPAA
jgi:EAL domain-containing protein (putative c-di-GMP-specific phosphodiesterase class I)